MLLRCDGSVAGAVALVLLATGHRSPGRDAQQDLVESDPAGRARPRAGRRGASAPRTRPPPSSPSRPSSERACRPRSTSTSPGSPSSTSNGRSLPPGATRCEGCCATAPSPCTAPAVTAPASRRSKARGSMLQLARGANSASRRPRATSASPASSTKRVRSWRRSRRRFAPRRKRAATAERAELDALVGAPGTAPGRRRPEGRGGERRARAGAGNRGTPRGRANRSWARRCSRPSR